MKRLLDKGFLLAGVTAFLFWQSNQIWNVAGLFLCSGIVCLYTYLQKQLVRQVFWGIAAAVAFVAAPAGVYLVVFGYDLIYEQDWLPAALGIIIAARSYSYYGITGGIVFCLLLLAAVLLADTARRYEKLQQQYKTQRDSSRELELLLKGRNKELIEKKDYEVHLATLRERNRIAREIHDNVGHMLSRSILQVGAVKAVNRQEQIVDSLTAVADTLNQAMDSIRSSVHKLYDESLDLKLTIADILKDYEMYTTVFNYDIVSELSRELNYCFLSIIKEALVNVVKHSNGTEIQITLREFSGQYQLIFRDNGSLPVEISAAGIGLENMRERVAVFDGMMYFRQENGFMIFVSIPIERSRQQ